MLRRTKPDSAMKLGIASSTRGHLTYKKIKNHFLGLKSNKWCPRVGNGCFPAIPPVTYGSP